MLRFEIAIYIIVGILSATSIIFILYLHFYFLPQYLIDIVQYFFEETSVLFCKKKFKHNEQGKPYVSLTIDDSPTEVTDKLLDVLQKYDVKATFFVISSYVPGNETVMQRILSEGHEIANHLTKDEPSWLLSGEQFEKAILEWETFMDPWMSLQYRPEGLKGSLKWFRPGSAIFHSTMLQVLSTIYLLWDEFK